jgi:UDP-arabinose 4-epimerase
MSETILVTGGAGYVGSHACKALAAAGYRPVVYDSLERGHRWAVKWGPLETGDILDAAALKQAMTRHKPAAVMHFAAYAFVGESVAAPGLYYRNNVMGTLTLLEAMRDAGIGTFVFSSTCATYGVPLTPLLGEDHPQAPINPYGATKLMVERMLADYRAAYGLRYAALRYFNAAGADPDGEIGEVHDPETHLIPLALKAARGSGDPLTIFGDDYETDDGTCIRDYIHVCDLADAHIRALRRLLDGDEMLALNLGTGTGVSVRRLVETVESVTGRAVPHSYGPRRAGDPPVLVAANAKAKATLGWAPRLSDIETIIRTADAWEAGQA